MGCDCYRIFCDGRYPDVWRFDEDEARKLATKYTTQTGVAWSVEAYAPRASLDAALKMDREHMASFKAEVDAARADRDRMRAEVVSLRSALAPFSFEAANMCEHVPDSQRFLYEPDSDESPRETTHFKARDLRRARAAFGNTVCECGHHWTSHGYVSGCLVVPCKCKRTEFPAEVAKETP
jgi:hypothetical protein